MMAKNIAQSAQPASDLLARLPIVRGKYRTGVMLSDITWFRVGGAAEVFFTPADAEDFQHFLQHTPPEIPVAILGAGSNTLVRDGGVAGVMVKLGGGFANIKVENNILTAGAAALDMSVARAAAQHGLAGLAFFAGIPGSIGGALRMNAGAYGGETADCFTSAQGFTRTGEAQNFTKDDMGFSYRHCGLDENIFFTSARFSLQAGNADDILARMNEITTARASTQPVKSRTGGSTFRNPNGTDPKAAKAWKLIDAAGCRGLRLGDAQVSEQHCNFLINHGAAMAGDLENLGENIRQKVIADAGIDLHWEIKRIGQADTKTSNARKRGGAA